MIHKIEFSARNLTSNAGLFLLLEHARKNGIFDLIENDLVFENESTNKIKMNHIKSMLCGNFIGIEKLERLKLLQSDPLINEFDISIKEPETVSRFLGNFSYKTTQMLREINFKVFRKLLRKRKLKSITIDIDSNEAIFQLMMLTYNLFLLFKIDFVRTTEYRQQIKTFRLKYIFLAGKIIRTARSVVMKLSEKYPYREIYGKSLSG